MRRSHHIDKIADKRLGEWSNRRRQLTTSATRPHSTTKPHTTQLLNLKFDSLPLFNKILFSNHRFKDRATDRVTNETPLMRQMRMRSVSYQ